MSPPKSRKNAQTDSARLHTETDSARLHAQTDSTTRSPEPAVDSQSTHGNRQPTDGSAAGDTAERRGLTVPNVFNRAVFAGLFVLLGVVSLSGGFHLLVFGGSVPLASSYPHLMGLALAVFGGAYLYAGYGIWQLNRSGWTLGVWLLATGGLVSLLGLLSGGVRPGVAGVLVSGFLGWLLYTSLEQFQAGNPVTANPVASGVRSDTGNSDNSRQSGTTGRCNSSPAPTRTGAGESQTRSSEFGTTSRSGYASRRRGRM